MLDCESENFTIQDFVYGNKTCKKYFILNFLKVDTNYGVQCPMISGIYKRITSKVINQKSSKPLKQQLTMKTQESCKYFTQTHTLQVGCQSSDKYSLKTKLCYPNNQDDKKNDFSVSVETLASYTQLESEINLVCLAYWNQDGNNIVISRTMSNEILCSIWSYSGNKKKLKLLEIGSTCSYTEESNSRVNYEFSFFDTCQSELSQFKSFIKTYKKNSTSSKKFSLLNCVMFILFYNNNLFEF